MNKDKKNINKIGAIVCGAIIGFINGLLGGGGGMVCVPLLEKSLHLTEKESHATALVVILPLCIVSSLIYILYSNVDYKSLGIVGGGVIVGGVLGAFLLKKLSSKYIRAIFAILILSAGIRILVG